MLRISKMADYGVILLIQMAREEPDAVLTARALAQKTDIPVPTTVTLLKRLERGKVLASERGPQGGYKLARVPGEISIVDIISAADDIPALTQCTAEPAKPCELEATCPARDNWRLVNRLVTETLAGLSLAAMASRLTANSIRRQLSSIPTRYSRAGRGA